ncbi:MAG TPA: nucleoside triphosphate pyrophosphohydrolase family protein [Roseiflexaceae bacterium]|nr:nucleoside triphosphate pyrophosphohydrolase family protein [Roseiflexaceae bacterium]HMP42847.1 nucleoside triphosphate pyrophosphohydrolase family protein [Roseiflexaceae bacterium]
MELNEYQRLAMRTARDIASDERLMNAVLGLAGEAGEVAELLKKQRYHGHPLDTTKLIDELGDLLWYVALAADTAGVPLAEVAERNVAKLRRRYPAGFSEQASRERAE